MKTLVATLFNRYVDDAERPFLSELTLKAIVMVVSHKGILSWLMLFTAS